MGWEVGRRAFLCVLGFCYLVAFLSFYLQAQGLFGSEGLSPASLVVGRALNQPWALMWRYRPAEIGIDPYMDMISLAGALLSLLAASGLACFPVLAGCWILYAALNVIGAPFLPFQWDILLLEVGGLALLLAPPLPLVGRHHASPSAIVALRWCLYKIMFMSGVVKLQANCPTWMGLTALHYHYATQCLPTPFAWHAHQLPNFVQKMSVAGTFVIEIVLPFLFLLPWRSGRHFAANLNIVLMIAIMLTGNYTYFNLLTIALTLAALDDDSLVLRLLAQTLLPPQNPVPNPEGATSSAPATPKVRAKSWGMRGAMGFLHAFVDGAGPWVVMCLSFWALFGFRYADISCKDYPSASACLWRVAELGLDVSIAFSLSDFEVWVKIALHWTIPIFCAWAALWCWRDVSARGGWLMARGKEQALHTFLWNSWGLASGAAVALLAMCYIGASLVPLSSLSPSVGGAFPSIVTRLHAEASAWHLTSGYGLFRVMTGVGKKRKVLPNSGGQKIFTVARPELELQASEDGETWKPLEFRYKPGDVNAAPKWAGFPGFPNSFPGMHQPRLDWQMWFAALGSYHHNPWLINLVTKLLKGQDEVRRLMAPETWPEPYASGATPKLIRVIKYEYDFSRLHAANSTDAPWWTRKALSDPYLPPLSADNPSLADFARSQGVPSEAEAKGRGKATGWQALALWLVERAARQRETGALAKWAVSHHGAQARSSHKDKVGGNSPFTYTPASPQDPSEYERCDM